MDPNLLLAYVSLGTMAVIPIYFGSYASLEKIKTAKKEKRSEDKDEYHSSSEEEEETEALSYEEAYMFPIIGSGVLLSLYLVFTYLDRVYVDYLVTAYFAVLGCAAMTKMVVAVVRAATGIKELGFHLRLTRARKDIFKLRFTWMHIGAAVISFICTIYYAVTKNWIASNLYALAFATSAIQMIALDSFKTGFILLGGLFFYDIFWVFGTNVMVSVAKNFDAPIKVLFPRSFWVPEGEKLLFTMLGLGDIVIPGVFIAFSLRFDRYLALKSAHPPTRERPYAFPKPYFHSCFAAYIVGMITTFCVMHIFKAAQPALLYLSPACSFSVMIVALVRGQFPEMFQFKSESSSSNEAKSKGDKGRKGKSTTTTTMTVTETVTELPGGGKSVVVEEEEVVEEVVEAEEDAVEEAPVRRRGRRNRKG